MAAAKSQEGLGHFSRLNPAVYIHQPASKTSSSGPDLVLVAGWMNASIRNIAKYAAGYEKLYPSATILVIMSSSTDLLFRSKTANLNRVAPVLEVLYALPPDARFLVHAFSNGGAITSLLIAEQYLAKTGRQLPVTAMILDSSPGKMSFQATVRSFAVGPSKFFILRWLIVAMISFGYWIVKLLYWTRLQSDRLRKMREDLNSLRLFRLEAPRLYIYSLTDYIVTWQEIEEHIGDAHKSGYKVDTEKFSDTSHAGHLIGNDERYWGCVKRLWGTTL